jgi:hypothetical protein
VKILTLLSLALLFVACGSMPAPQPIQTTQHTQAAPASSAPPVVAVQPFPASTQGSASREAPPAAVQPVEPPPQTEAAAPGQQAEITIPSGTPIRVRLNQALDTRRNRAGDRFTATLAQPVVEEGRVILPRGTRFAGHVTTASPSGRLEGRAVLGITLDSFEVNGRQYPLVTSRASRVSDRHKKRNLVLIGGGSGVGALIGGLAGGGKGVLIGAGAGAGAGTAGAALTGKKEVALPAETLLTFRLEEAVEL